MTHADVLVGTCSGFSMLAAVLRPDGALVAFPPCAGDSNHFGLDWGQRRDMMGREYTTDAAQLGKQLGELHTRRCAAGVPAG